MPPVGSSARLSLSSYATYSEQFSFLDKDGNTERGEYLTPSKEKALKEFPKRCCAATLFIIELF